jgi:hypothetical protein
MHKRAKFLFFCMIFVASSAASQNLNYISPANKGFLFSNVTDQNSNKINIYKAFHQTSNKKNIPEIISIKPVVLLNPVSCSVIAADYYTQGFGFFCKKELQFEKITKIPLRFRLGTLQYNNYLEGKPNTGILPSH